jgi:lysophospholipase L1-like esterase
MKKTFLLLALTGLFLTSGKLVSTAAESLQSGDYVAVIGDSITEQKIYSMFIEDYLLMCQPAADLRVTQFGWGGETAPGFAGRMANDCLRFKPTVATTCFGMNDGGYSPMDAGKGKRYRDGQKSIVKQLKDAGARFIVVGSPGVVDADKFRNPEAAKMYNPTLAALRDISKEVAAEEGVAFANVFDPMMDVMTKAKAEYGNNYHVGGGDGVHPDRNGHLVMAYAFLKALGCSGDIGTITVNLKSGKAEATTGHKILSAQGGTVEVESSRYPFCFFGDPAKTSATRGVIKFFPFNEDLNRFRLVVDGAGADRVKVTWGENSKEFAAADLAKGINLAAEFLDNPFCGAFQEVESKIASQQNMETDLIKRLIHDLPAYMRAVPEEKETLNRIGDTLVQKDKVARDASAAAVKPVRHTLKIEAVK